MHLVPFVGSVRNSFLVRECFTGALVFGNQVLLSAIPTEGMDLVVHPARQTVTVDTLSPNIPMSLAK